MTLTKIAKRVTPSYTFYAYENSRGRTYWLNPYNNKFIPLNKSLLKSWQLLKTN
jgi:hypothetical protein